MTRSILCMLLLIVTATRACGQEKLFEEALPDIEWGEGSIMLNSGEDLKGLIRFNDRKGIVSFESGSTSRSYTPRSVSAFEFFDSGLERQRVFFTIEFTELDKTVPHPVFFEVLKDFKTFAVLTKMDPVKIKQETRHYGAMSGGMGAGFTTSTVKIEQIETVYFMNEKGEVEPYVKIIRKVKDRTVFGDTEKKTGRWVDSDLLEKYFTPEQIESMQNYAEANQLTFKLKEDLRKILDSVQR